MNEHEYKEALSHWPTGISVVATKFEGKLFGFTASSLTSVSLTPPLVSFCLDKKATCLSAFMQMRVFSVSILSEHQVSLSKHFAKHLEDKFANIEYILGATSNCPLINDAVCSLECDKVHEYDTGDHVIFIGEVKVAQVNNNLNPLIYYIRKYWQLDNDSL